MPDETSPTRLRVFLCHSSGDKPPVRDLYRKLSSDGFDPWLDEEKLLPGQNWDREIRLAVCKSDIVLACLSKESITKTGYIQKELKFALDVADEQPEGRIFIIPAKLEECGIPERLKGLHVVNLFDPNGYSRLVQALQHRAETIVAGPSRSDQKSTPKSFPESSEIDAPRATQPSSPRPSLYKATIKNSKSGLAIVIALIALVTLVIAYWQFRKPEGTDDQVQYTGRVLHALTQHPVANAKVSVETQGPPNVYYTDTEGIFNLKLPKTVDSARIRVEAEGYGLPDRNISVSRSGIEYLLLSPISIASPAPSPSPPEKNEKVRSALTPKAQRPRLKIPCSPEGQVIREVFRIILVVVERTVTTMPFTKSLRITIPVVTYAAVLCILTAPVLAQTSRRQKNVIKLEPLITSLKARNIPISRLTQLIRAYGVDFKLTPDVENRIRSSYLGTESLDDLVSAIRDNYSSPEGIMAFVKGKLSDSKFGYRVISGSIDYSYNNVEVSRCKLSWQQKRTVHWHDSNVRPDPTTIGFEINLSDIDPEQIRLEQFLKELQIWSIIMTTTNSENKIKSFEFDVSFQSTSEITFPDKTLAERVLAALREWVAACGGKSEPY